MIKTEIRIALPLALLSGLALAGCMESGGDTRLGAQIQASQAIGTVLGSTRAEPSPKDLAKSCQQLETERAVIFAKYEDIQKIERARERKAGLIGGIADAGLTVIGTRALGNSGSVSGIRNTDAALGMARSATGHITVGSGPGAQSFASAQALIERGMMLERARLNKGCS